MVEFACRKERMFRGQAGYSNCVSQQLASLGWISKPLLAGVSSDDRAMIESACQTQRVSGPGSLLHLRQPTTCRAGCESE